MSYLQNRRFQLLIFILLLSSYAFCQSISQSVISSAGEYQIGKYAKTLHFTLGELMVENFENTNVLSQGFHQLYQVTVDVDYTAPIDYSLTVYPNPTSGWLQLNTDSELNFDVVMYDMNGKMIFQSVSNKYQTDFDIGNLAEGLYYLSVLHEHEIVKTFKIAKHSFK